MKQIEKVALFLKMAWNLKPIFLVLLVLNSIMVSCQTFANVILPKYLIDCLIEGEENYVFVYTVVIVVSNAAFYFLDKLIKRAMTVNQEYITKGFHARLANKVMSVEYRHLENPYYLDLKERAIFAVENQSALENLVKYLTEFFRLLFIGVGLAVIMFRLSILLVVFLLITIVVIVGIQASFSGEQVKFFNNLIPINRRYNYYFDLSKENACQKDIRLYDLSGMISDRLTEFIGKTIGCFKNFTVKYQLITSITGALSVLQTAFAYGYVAIRCISDRFGERIGIGSFTMYVNSAMKFSTTIMSLGEAYVMLGQMLGYLQPFMELLEIPDEEELSGDIMYDGSVKSIRFEHVSFTYPKTEKKILEDVSFTIREGEKISIVGLNGAGKTTLVKLLCRLYHPDRGKIYLNDIDIFEYNYESYLSAISAVFQDYKLFNFTVEENITCKEAGADTEGALEAVKHTGMYEKIHSLANGIKSLYGKEYDKEGIQLSGGQSQKIAIARALYKDADLVVMDEPTSALDPIAEAEIYEQFNKLVGKRTAIYISHRMSSSVFCDKVLILDSGRVSDFAPHEQLMEKEDSLYYEMFMAQAVNYQV